MQDLVKETKERLKNESQKSGIRKQFKNQITVSIVGALGFVAGLAWNDAIREIINYIFPFSKDGIIAKSVYAILITAIVIFVTIYISKKSNQKE